MEKARSETVAKLWRVTEEMNILYPENWTRIAAEEILWFQDQLTKAIMLELTTMTSTSSKVCSLLDIFVHNYHRICTQIDVVGFRQNGF